ncbi:hypothetical protein [Falsirhodobacter sp. 1013]|uniref:hypothetical protein n=1 Tax=Falsirhodobacter sp. 1013 TaxID=3417566 RepID=UPI003EB6E8B8
MGTRHALVLTLCLAPGLAGAEAPMSAIDWLSQSVTAPPPPAAPPEPPQTTVPDAPVLDVAGLLTPRQTGLSRDLWGAGSSRVIAEKITAMPVNTLPALHELAMNVLLAETHAPRDAGTEGLVFFARLDKLLAVGALEQAQALLDVSGAAEAKAFRRQFDIALLLGTEDRACETLDAAPQLAPTYPARIYCTARTGDWSAAVVVLHSAQALGLITPEEDALISRFLDPELFEGEPPLPPPPRPTPLEWRMFEAIGEPLPTLTLPLAYAHAELRDSSGWKAQLDAAERLTRAGVLDPNRLLGLYTLQRPAASGGVWDRADAIQTLDRAVTEGDARAAAQALPLAWSAMAGAELEVAFSRMYAPQLLALPLMGDAALMAARMGLLTGRLDGVQTLNASANAEDRFLTAIATGSPATAPTVDGLSRAIAGGFSSDPVPPEADELLSEQRRGEALLLAMTMLSRGAQGDLQGVTEGISTLRALGLEPAARRVALQLMILERRG